MNICSNMKFYAYTCIYYTSSYTYICSWNIYINIYACSFKHLVYIHVPDLMSVL